LPGTAKHFTGNALCSSDDSVKQFIHILQNNATYKSPEEKSPEELNLENEEGGN